MTTKIHSNNADRQKAYRERNRIHPKHKALTVNERAKKREDKLFNFKEVRLHLVCSSINEHSLGEEGFSFRYRPKKEDIYFNFSGMEYKEDTLIIGGHGLAYYEKGRKGIFYKIIKYRNQFPYVKIIDERTTEQRRFMPYDYKGSMLIHKANKEGWKIVDECKKYPGCGDFPGCKLTLREIFNEDTHNPFSNDKYFPGIEDKRLLEDFSCIVDEEELISVMRTALKLTYRECVDIINDEALKDYMDGMNGVQSCDRNLYNRNLLYEITKPQIIEEYSKIVREKGFFSVEEKKMGANYLLAFHYSHMRVYKHPYLDNNNSFNTV